ncbi:MAG TPA: crossover junction endodeoxyribonuclease RuvC [Deltaproteobacteria bacterium]|nr:crossover junction endodeoxyribonuclease RuvC [Deltaproteobacteria bacterium]
MVVLGIDPGSCTTGFGVVRTQRGRLHLIEGGCVRTSSSDPMGERLLKIHEGLSAAFDRHPEVTAVAIEAIFKHKSSESALRLGQARGVALLVAVQHGFEPVAYNPGTVKRTVGAHGRADKHAIGRIVSMLLGETPEGPHDVADALAIAITHINHIRNGAAA